ncbi:ATP-binding protein [Pseudofrankia sp. DC12]|uniref:AAA family ATPase n=1 Tax=Pseudofrankia sp. DC12 TaxID=683315 RepID=UPI0005F7E3CB|nr:ATP-binding protein [Pseudofrankia sp. DC12]
MERPADMFDRDEEWAALAAFCEDPAPGAMLGVVTGRRRQGKSFLLEAACEQTGGLYHQALEGTGAESLRLFGERFAAHTGAAAPLAFSSWPAAIDAVLGLGLGAPTTVVIDEFPYLMKAAPELPSAVQAALGPRRAERTASRTRLILCGSALSVMGRLLAGSAPLRGRAALELVVPSLDFRLAREFWEIEDPLLAARLHAVVGGTPAYRDFARRDAPRGLDDFDAWVVRTVLNRNSPLFREARYLLAEEPDLRDPGLYSSVLAAVATGAVTRGAISNAVGRGADELGHPLTVLADAGFLVKADDLLRDRRPVWRIAEPLIAFYHAVVRPVFGQLEARGQAARTWSGRRATFASQVLGPNFEEICRTWTSAYASAETLGTDDLGEVGHGAVHDHEQRAAMQFDVVALGPADGQRRRLVALGEAKWGIQLGLEHLDRLRRGTRLVEQTNNLDVSSTRLLLFSAVGFTDQLRAGAASDRNVVLVDLGRLYEGD